jgi:hypothetical protein
VAISGQYGLNFMPFGQEPLHVQIRGHDSRTLHVETPVQAPTGDAGGSESPQAPANSNTAAILTASYSVVPSAAGPRAGPPPPYSASAADWESACTDAAAGSIDVP